MSMLRGILRLAGTVSRCRDVTKVPQSFRQYAAAAEEVAKPVVSTQMSFTFGMPGQMFYSDADIKQVDVATTTGCFGILPQHVPSLAVLRPGLLSVYEHDGTTNQYFVSSGSVTVNADSSVQILAEMACLLDDLDPVAVKEGLSSAQQELSSASTDLARAEAEIAIQAHEAMEQAIAAK